MRLLATVILLILCLSTPSWAAQNTKAKQAFIVDNETGQVLLSKNADQHMPTSSMSKVMTIYMVFDALKNGTLEMDAALPVSEKAWRKAGSKMFVEVGKKVKVKDLLRGVIVQSGNDATIVLAEGLAKSEDAFAKIMTKKAIELGMENSNFVNASGWPDPDHYSTAEDLALMAKRVIEDFPEYYKFYSETEFTYNNIKQQNRNPLLYRDIGADGLKTGHTEAGGYGLIGTAVKEDRRVIMVVNGLESEKDRADEAARLIEWALNTFTNIDLAKAEEPLSQAPTAMGKMETVSLVLEKDIKLTIPKSARNNFTVDVKYNSPLIAPIKQGQQVGTMTVNIPSMEPLQYPLFAGHAVEELGLFKKTWAKMKYFVRGAL